MNKRKTRGLSASNEEIQKEIARRLKAGLPLAGLVSAALFCGGCDKENSEWMGRHLQGDVAPREETSCVREDLKAKAGTETVPEPNSVKEEQPEPPPLSGAVILPEDK